MKKTLIVVSAIVFFILLFLNPSKKDSEPARIGPKLLPYQEQATLFNSIQTQPAVSNSGQQGASTMLANSGTRPALNPPHGQPWHRCEIPVGAPLDSEPNNTLAQTTNNTPVTTAPQAPNTTTPANTGARPTLNPPHGQPWHRCEIPVGAPLDSEPETPARQTTSATPPTTPEQEAISPTVQHIENAIQLNSSQNPVTTPENVGIKPALNPAHGQPWHRCDIRVGDPLP